MSIESNIRAYAKRCAEKQPEPKPAQGHTPANYREENKRLRDVNTDLLAASKELVADASKNNEPFPCAIVRQSKLVLLQAAIAKAEGRAE